MRAARAQHRQQRLVEQKGDVLHVVVRSVGARRLLARLPRVDALEDAQPPEVGQAELQLLQRLGTGAG